MVHADETEKVNTLISHIQACLYQRELEPQVPENAFARQLCNRIDHQHRRNIIHWPPRTRCGQLRILNQKIRDHEVEKSYLCVTVGRPSPAKGKVEGFSSKDVRRKSRSPSCHPAHPGGKTAADAVSDPALGELSPVDCRLLTGRTHQIRVSMAHLGCPLLGGTVHRLATWNRRYGETRQLLYSYKLSSLPLTPGLIISEAALSPWQEVPFRGRYSP